MTPFIRPDRRCPKCDSPKYLFRARKTIDTRDGGSEVETKYRCQACQSVWKERVPVSAPSKSMPGESDAA